MSDFIHTQWIVLILVLISVKLFVDHRKKNYVGVYKPYNNYEQISYVKHDLFKIFVVQLIPLLVYGIASGDKFYDSSNPLNSWVGKTATILTGFFIFYELVQPYVLTKLPYW